MKYRVCARRVHIDANSSCTHPVFQKQINWTRANTYTRNQAIAYFISSLDSQTCGREREVSRYSCKLGVFSYKTMNYYWANFQKFPTEGISWRKKQTLTEFFI